MTDTKGDISPIMSASEALERSTGISNQMGETYGRLQRALLLPLMRRSIAIMEEKGLIPTEKEKSDD